VYANAGEQVTAHAVHGGSLFLPVSMSFAFSGYLVNATYPLPPRETAFTAHARR
jgi:hypothetical protein